MGSRPPVRRRQHRLNPRIDRFRIPRLPRRQITPIQSHSLCIPRNHFSYVVYMQLAFVCIWWEAGIFRAENGAAIRWDFGAFVVVVVELFKELDSDVQARYVSPNPPLPGGLEAWIEGAGETGREVWRGGAGVGGWLSARRRVFLCVSAFGALTLRCFGVVRAMVCRTRWCRWQQVPDGRGYARRRCDELRGQLRYALSPAPLAAPPAYTRGGRGAAATHTRAPAHTHVRRILAHRVCRRAPHARAWVGYDDHKKTFLSTL
eukprot:COSAG02_NODE_1946_length_10302_cov_13.656768_5_plen_261_part_00